MARPDLNPIEEARACATLVEDLGLTKEELGRRVGRSRAAISNLVRLLELPDEVLELIGRATSPRATAARCSAARTTPRAAAWPAPHATAAGRSGRPSAGPARRRYGPRQEPRPVLVHPDLDEALGAAEDALSRRSAAGEGEARGPRCVVEIEFDSPAEAIALAQTDARLSGP